jgi:hypothetical protein
VSGWSSGSAAIAGSRKPSRSHPEGPRFGACMERSSSTTPEVPGAWARSLSGRERRFPASGLLVALGSGHPCPRPRGVAERSQQRTRSCPGRASSIRPTRTGCCRRSPRTGSGEEPQAQGDRHSQAERGRRHMASPQRSRTARRDCWEWTSSSASTSERRACGTWRGDWAKESGGSELVSVEQQDAIVRHDPVERGQLRPQTSRRRAIRAQEPERACFISRDHGGSTGAKAMGVLGGFDEFEDRVTVVHEERVSLAIDTVRRVS